MPISERFELEILELIEALSCADFDKLSANQWLGRLAAQDVAQRIDEYGKRLLLPPTPFLQNVDLHEYRDGSGWALDIPLWTEEEGISDLTLSLELLVDPRGSRLQMTDLRVL
ncbi:DUF7668 domain-containing protein [Pseudomonas sp. Fl4BN1]|uniref:DUF7668 domain-containing protein n=1 Tax=Pseudomonas sp. Fl4BN1 TaxID=2697651 RepID=UPI001376DB30|nr:hypothetical protein [Pseudomonas sp. Fl4BN1]NBF11429.1 hypothetical protein [Pseudomonas sp. Fl4BN1]